MLYAVIYSAYFHPLSKYAGPPSLVVSELGRIVAFLGGNFPRLFVQLHAKYGEVVRSGPQDLTFFTPDAWQDIYGQGKQKVFIKDPRSYRAPPGGVRDLLTASDADHRRYRTLVGHAFSDRALKEQQPIIDSHVDLLMQRLREVSKTGRPIDIHQWFNYTTFDIIGDLAFGEPFGCLESSTYHPWVSQLFPYLKTVAFVALVDSWVPMKYWLPWTPKFLIRTMSEHMAMTKEKVERRLAAETSRKDFIHFILRYNDEKGMNHEELIANMSLIIIAGSETTTTALAATIYLLLKNPAMLERLRDEIRAKFRGVEDMSLDRLNAFAYLNAVVQESMRLHPPAPGGFPRLVTKDGAVVAGHPVPKGVSIHLVYVNKNSYADLVRPRYLSKLTQPSVLLGTSLIRQLSIPFVGWTRAATKAIAWTLSSLSALGLATVLGRIWLGRRCALS